MANIKKPENKIKKNRTVTLNDEQVDYITCTLGLRLTEALEKFIEISKKKEKRKL